MRVRRPSARLWLVLALALAALVAAGVAASRPARAAGKVKLTMFIWAGANPVSYTHLTLPTKA